MKLDQLRKIIREEVRSAVKEELQEVMNEAVRVASTPTMQPAPQAGTTSWSAPTKAEPKKPSRQELAEMIGLPPTPKPTNLDFGKKGDPISEMLNMTQQQMTPTEYSNVIGGSGAQKPNFASQQAANMGMSSVEAMQGSLDISQLGFVKKAKQVLDKANEKSANKL